MKQKKSMVLLEVIFSMTLFSIILIYTMNISLSLQVKSTKRFTTTYKNLQLETTRLFLSKNNDFNKITFENGVLYYDNNILLNDINSYYIDTTDQINKIEICLKGDICQKWIIKSV